MDLNAPGQWLLKEIMYPRQVDVISADFSRGIRQLMGAEQSGNAINHLMEGANPTPAVRPSGFFLDTCITDNNLPGWVVTKSSAAFRQSSASVRVGRCLFFNIPSDPLSSNVSPHWSTASSTPPASKLTDGAAREPNAMYLRSELADGGDLRFFLSFTGALHDVLAPHVSATAAARYCEGHGTGGPGWISNLDVTECVREYAVRAHVAVRLGGLFDSYSLEYLEGGAGDARGGGARRRPERPLRLYVTPEPSPVDWLAVEAGGAEAGTPDDACGAYQRMLCGFFAALRARHARVLVYEPRHDHATSRRWTLRFASAALLRDGDGGRRGLVGYLREGGLAQRRKLDGAFGRGPGGPCRVQLPWRVGRAPKVLYCVPLFGPRGRGRRPRGWRGSASCRRRGRRTCGLLAGSLGASGRRLAKGLAERRRTQVGMEMN